MQPPHELLIGRSPFTGNKQQTGGLAISRLSRPPERPCQCPQDSWRLGLTDSVLTRVAALKALPIPALKQQWRELFDTEPPPYNRRFLEHRLAYRIQELAYGGLKPETLKRLRDLAEDLDGGDPTRRCR